MLFKYLDPDRLDVLENAHIRFTQPADFNDPFEFKPIVSTIATAEERELYINQNLERLVEEKLLELPVEVRSFFSSRELQEDVKILHSIYSPMIEREFASIVKEFPETFHELSSKNIGVLSLAEDHANLLMWSHYARSHKGFCIGFEKKAKFFNRKRTNVDEFYHLRKVNYSAKRPTKKMSEVTAVELLLNKSDIWGYEKEWRMCALLEDSTRKIDAAPYAIHLFNFPKEIVKEVILGVNIEDCLREKIINLVKQDVGYKHVTIKQAKVSGDEFALDFTSIN